MTEMNRRHEEEMRSMQNKLHVKNDAAFSKFKQALQESMSKTQASVPTNEQVLNTGPIRF